MLWSTSTNRKFFFKTYGKSNKELNALIEKKFKKFVKNKKRRKTEKELWHFQETQISDNKDKKSVLSMAESVKSGKISSFRFEWKSDLEKLFATCLNNNIEYKKQIQFKNTWIFWLILVQIAYLLDLFL